MLILSCRSVYELIGDSNFRDIGEGERREGFFSEMEDFFCSVGGREKCRKRGRKQEAARKRRDSIGAMTARPVLRFHRRARERALVSREFDRYSGINS